MTSHMGLTWVMAQPQRFQHILAVDWHGSTTYVGHRISYQDTSYTLRVRHDNTTGLESRLQQPAWRRDSCILRLTNANGRPDEIERIDIREKRIRFIVYITEMRVVIWPNGLKAKFDAATYISSATSCLLSSVSCSILPYT